MNQLWTWATNIQQNHLWMIWRLFGRSTSTFWKVSSLQVSHCSSKSLGSKWPRTEMVMSLKTNDIKEWLFMSRLFFIWSKSSKIWQSYKQLKTATSGWTRSGDQGWSPITAVEYNYLRRWWATPRQLPIQVVIRCSTDQWLSAVKQSLSLTDQSLSDVKQLRLLNRPTIERFVVTWAKVRYCKQKAAMLENVCISEDVCQ